ncbi:hypothetical protein PCASD_05350 [Puccinia coronata f. sp. avenae]|uniref:Uncharacterized protein n=1 Tax=Puccinia coronata f. sp. avenae TaxID=200324 RepID=A0A2N5UNA6_9BASI|nr:hypothetical protein PCASD_05350 [Puccinia coronata f. sp. avenae]
MPQKGSSGAGNAGHGQSESLGPTILAKNVTLYPGKKNYSSAAPLSEHLDRCHPPRESNPQKPARAEDTSRRTGLQPEPLQPPLTTPSRNPIPVAYLLLPVI